MRDEGSHVGAVRPTVGADPGGRARSLAAPAPPSPQGRVPAPTLSPSGPPASTHFAGPGDRRTVDAQAAHAAGGRTGGGAAVAAAARPGDAAARERFPSCSARESPRSGPMSGAGGGGAGAGPALPRPAHRQSPPLPLRAGCSGDPSPTLDCPLGPLSSGLCGAGEGPRLERPGGQGRGFGEGRLHSLAWVCRTQLPSPVPRQRSQLWAFNFEGCVQTSSSQARELAPRGPSTKPTRRHPNMANASG